MGKLINLLEKLVFLIAGAVLVFIAHVSRSQAETLDMATLDADSSWQVQVVQQQQAVHVDSDGQ